MAAVDIDSPGTHAAWHKLFEEDPDTMSQSHFVESVRTQMLDERMEFFHSLAGGSKFRTGLAFPDSDGFGGGSDSGGFGWIPGPRIWNQPTQIENEHSTHVGCPPSPPSFARLHDHSTCS